MAFHKAIAAAEIPLGDKRGVVIDGREVVVFHAEDGFHAFADRCPHLGAPLSEVGFVKGEEILCVLHCAKFALATGRVLASPAEEDLESYACRVDRGIVWVDLP
ncbi:MAG: Rieske 2Fe-2S domain-containing protein [Acidobacteria bacterium]|nr:Rieske 2Fe-2S domain-containing protein [Acidobacteriota bacterium]